MADYDSERFMIEVKPLAAQENLIHDDRVATSDVTLHRTPHFPSESPGTQFKYVEVNKTYLQK